MIRRDPMADDAELRSDLEPAAGARPESADTRPTIEQRYELETTLCGLGLESAGIAVPLGNDDRFLLRRLLGRGSMGAVYLADDVELERQVAIKVVARRIERDHLVLRLRREARALAQLDHPNVIRVFDIGNEHGERFIAMEYVAGQTLRQWQADRSLDQVLEAYVQAGRGLAAAHARDIVHRDFKPDNVLVNEEDGRLRVRVGDFGLAGQDPIDDGRVSEPATHGLKTSSKVLMGTLPYMAPEQLRRERADARSDQHQLCVALWEAVVGMRPFGPAGRPLTGDATIPPCPSAMPRWLHRVLDRGLAFERQARYPSMRELLHAIERGRRWRRARPWLLGIGLVAAGVSASVAMQPDPCAAAAETMASIWSADARADIEAAFGPQDAMTGSTMAEHLVGRLDEAATRWSDRAQQVCAARERATAVERPELERRATCIERWADRMEGRIAWLRHPDEARMAQAFELVAPLALAGDSCATPPIIIDERVEVALEQAEQAELLRDLDGARVLADAAVELAKTHGSSCTTGGAGGEPRSSELAAAWFRLGHVLGERGDPKASLEALTHAHQHARACNDEHRDAEARTHAAKVLAADLEDVDAAAAALDDAWVALEHVEEPPTSLRRYDERMAAGIVAERRGDYEAARHHAAQARAALGHPDREPILDAKLAINVGVAWHKEGRYAEAAEAYARATALVGGALGSRHPHARLHAARQALNLGLAAQEAGDHAQMRRQFAMAAASAEPPVVAKALTAWAQGEYVAGDGRNVAARTADLLAFLARGPELPPVTLATAEATAGQLLVELDDPRAIFVLERACAHWREHGAPEPVAACELSLGAALRDAGRGDDALRVLERLRGLEVAATGPFPAAIEEFASSLRSAPASPGSPSTDTQGPPHP